MIRSLAIFSVFAFASLACSADASAQCIEIPVIATAGGTTSASEAQAVADYNAQVAAIAAQFAPFGGIKSSDAPTVSLGVDGAGVPQTKATGNVHVDPDVYFDWFLWLLWG